MSILTLDEISLHFGGVKALNGLSLDVQPGSLHGLIGPNGAGKTTAMNVVSGLHRPSAGLMTFGGKPFHPKPHQLATFGLARAFQAAAIIGSLNAFDNVLLGGYASTRSGIVASALRLPGAVRAERALRARAEEALDEVGYVGSKAATLAEMSVWQRRQIEIARSLLSHPKMLLLDEPAAGLTGSEVEALRRLMQRLRDSEAGMAILLVEHNVPLVFSLCDSVTAMAEGRRIAHGTPAAVRSHDEVIRSYLGAGASASPATVAARPVAEHSVVLQVKKISAGYGPNTVLHGIDLEIRKGETVALFGPNGAGKTTLMNAIVGERPVTSGSVTWQGSRIDGQPIQTIVRRGIGIVPQGRAVLVRQSVEDNLLISTTGLGIGARQFRERLDETYTRFPSLGRRRKSLGASLSGGERQMLAIAKVLIRRPALLMLDEPSIGLAPTVVDEVQRIVADLSGSGLSVLIGEQSVGWVVPLAHRAYAISAGRIVAEGSAAALADTASLADQYLGGENTKLEVA